MTSDAGYAARGDHRVQFTSVPWLRGYVQGLMTEFLLASDMDPGAIATGCGAAAGAVGRRGAWRRRAEPRGGDPDAGPA